MNKQEIIDKIVEMAKEIKKLKEELNKQEEASRKWKPELHNEYYCIDSTGAACVAYWENWETDKIRYTLGNVFKTQEEAKFAIEQFKIISQLKEYADDDKEWDGDNWHWCIEYNANERRIKVDYFFATKNVPFNIYFSSDEQAQKAINAIGKERLKKYYFCVEE